MFVVMRTGATEAEVNGVKGLILAEGLTPFENAGTSRTVIAVVGEIGKRREQLKQRLEAHAGRRAGHRRSPSPTSSCRASSTPRTRSSGCSTRSIGDGSLTVMAGPCSVESRDQLMETVDFVAAHGATIIRGGAFKPRTSPYSFQGLGVEGLRYLAEARERTRHAGDHRGHGPEPGRHRRRVRRHPPGRHPQHAELLAAARLRAREPAGDAQARLRGHDRGVADGRGVHRVRRQPQRHPVRARHPDVRDDRPATRSTSPRSRSSTT